MFGFIRTDLTLASLSAFNAWEPVISTCQSSQVLLADLYSVPNRLEIITDPSSRTLQLGQC